MGFNSTVVVMNDLLSTIRDDKDFGEKLVNAVLDAALTRPVPVDRATRSAVVVASHHSSVMLPVLVGSNTGVPVSATVPWDATSAVMEKELLLKLAHKHGYTLRKKPR